MHAATTDAPVAILGGTFDPVHYGHLRLADEVRAALRLPEVRLVPAGKPPHRVPPRASAGDRVAMLEIAVREFPGLVVDTREITRGGKSYTSDTLDELRAEMPARPIALLLGADAFRGLASWHRWRSLFELAHLVVVPRPGVAIDAGLVPELAAEWAARRSDDPQVLRTRPHGAIYVQPVTAHPISSTEIRAAVARGDAKSVEFAGLLPAAVLAYIESNRLYSSASHAS
jgi:nicotinate-nucleotide adenylyltransferase